MRGAQLLIFLSLALAEMRLILARIVFNFDMRLAEPDKDWLQHSFFTLWEKPPLMVHLDPAER